MTTTTDTTELMQALEDVTPNCQHAHPGELNDGLDTPCQQRAEYYSEYHACQPDEPGIGPGTILWCSKHLADTTTRLLIKLKRPDALGCARCRAPLTTLPEWIWGTTPIS